MRKGKMKAMALLMGAMFLLQPAVSAKAETQQPQEEVAQTIVYEEEVYELYKVEKIPSATVFCSEDEGIRTEREVTNYYYRSASTALSGTDFCRYGNYLSTFRSKNNYSGFYYI